MGRGRYSPQEQEFYQRYLQSPEWKRKKNARIKQAGYRCEFITTRYEPGKTVDVRCERTRYLCVHHNTYEHLGDEPDKDLDVFCYLHHMVEHLLWKKCVLCGQPCLGYDQLAEMWLMATLYQMGIDIDNGPINWRALPTKELLAEQIDAKCMQCRGVIVQLDDS